MTTESHQNDYSLPNGNCPGPDRVRKLDLPPTHKDSNKETANNYRTISLASSPWNMIEHILLHYMNQKLKDFSTSEAKKTTRAIVLNLKKSFDKVSYTMLMHKLKLIPDMHLQLMNWIQDFLTDNRKKVVLKMVFSSVLKVASGVPQGSVLNLTYLLSIL